MTARYHWTIYLFINSLQAISKQPLQHFCENRLEFLEKTLDFCHSVNKSFSRNSIHMVQTMPIQDNLTFWRLQDRSPLIYLENNQRKILTETSLVKDFSLTISPSYWVICSWYFANNFILYNSSFCKNFLENVSNFIEQLDSVSFINMFLSELK